MYERKYEFHLEGLSPLIMHWDNIEWADQMEAERTEIKEKDKALFKAGDDRCPPHTWKGYTYNDGRHIVLPNDNLRSCLMKAGARIELKGKKTFKELTQCAILFDDLYIAFQVDGRQIEWPKIQAIKGVFAEQAAAVKALGFMLFVKRAAVGQAKHVRVRPRFDKWSAQGTITVLDEQVTADIVSKLWRIAGLYIGACDWRPGSPRSPGPYGRFKTTIKTV